MTNGRRTVCQVRCPIDGDQRVTTADLVIDDEDDVYRFTCPTCGRAIDKPLDERIRNILRGAGVATVDELCASFEALLRDDRALVRGLLNDPA